MGNRIRSITEKVEPVLAVLDQINVDESARKVGVPPSTLRYDLDKLKAGLPELLSNQKPGPKAEVKRTAEPKTAVDRPRCAQCDRRLVKNGTYWVLNWASMLLMGWLGVQKVEIQRWRCRECGIEVADKERERQSAARIAWWQVGNRLIALSRFKLGLSERKTQMLIEFTYGKAVSKISAGSLCALKLEGVIVMLQDPTIVIQTATVRLLAKRFQKFVNKHGEAIDQLLQLAVETNAPKTTNALESKNSIFKPFSRIAKFFLFHRPASPFLPPLGSVVCIRGT